MTHVEGIMQNLSDLDSKVDVICTGYSKSMTVALKETLKVLSTEVLEAKKLKKERTCKDKVD